MRFLKSKRGLALENAILFMVIVFSLCTLLTSFVLLGSTHAKLAESAFFDRLATEQILEDFLADPTTFESGERDGYAYVAGADGEKFTLAVHRQTDETQKTRLYIEAAQIDGRWCVTYRGTHAPTP